MNDSIPDYSASQSLDGRRSGMVFTVILLLVLLAVAFPEMAPQGLLGILWTGAGLLMLLFPPVVRVPRVWIWLAAGFVLFSLVGFLPREWFHVSSWRTDLEKLGLDTGTRAFVQPRLAVEVMAGFAATALVALFLLGHRIDSRCHRRLALGFVIGVGAWTTAALIQHQPGGLFGFFPNRNNTASLLAMGVFVGLGSLAQAISRKDFWYIALSIIPTALCLYVLHAVSESRAGVVLVFVGFVSWILLSGFRHLQGNVGKALVLILIAASGVFLIVDSTVKNRLTGTIDRVVASGPNASATLENPFAESEVAPRDPPIDGRITILQDTLSMIRNESWTGVGPGQFALVFPQHREKTDASNDARCLHPESDWFLMLAEVGWPATLCLVAGVIVVFFTAVMQIRRGRSRFLRIGCVVAVLLLCIHGFVDVPGHRVGIAWAAAFLLASSLRPSLVKGSEPASGPSLLSRTCWRVVGMILALAGIYLVHAQWSGKSVLPSVQARQHMIEAKSLYDQDTAAYEQARIEGRDYQPEFSKDPIEIALLRVEQAIGITPLDPHLHFVRGVLALHYDDKQPVVEKAFALQRSLDPVRVSAALEQAQAWGAQDSRQVRELWKEALRRAELEESRVPGSSCGTANAYQRMLQTAGRNEALVSAALDLAEGQPSRLLPWSQSAPAHLLDREMPRLLAAPDLADARQPLFQIWEKRGTKGVAAEFARSHPELGLAPR